MHDETVKGMNNGKDLHTLMADIVIPPEFEVGQGYGKVSWSVRAIWENYAGWFHHDSTAELFSVPQRAVHADIVELAGGAEALLERASAKLAEGRREEAIHLLDIVRGAGAESERSRQLVVQAHEMLLEDSENFWLSSWLKNQIQ